MHTYMRHTFIVYLKAGYKNWQDQSPDALATETFTFNKIKVKMQNLSSKKTKILKLTSVTMI